MNPFAPTEWMHSVSDRGYLYESRGVIGNLYITHDPKFTSIIKEANKHSPMIKYNFQAGFVETTTGKVYNYLKLTNCSATYSLTPYTKIEKKYYQNDGKTLYAIRCVV
jgi:hypothetical protein